MFQKTITDELREEVKTLKEKIKAQENIIKMLKGEVFKTNKDFNPKNNTIRKNYES